MAYLTVMSHKLVSSKQEQRPYRIDAASHVGAAVLAQVVRLVIFEASVN